MTLNSIIHARLLEHHLIERKLQERSFFDQLHLFLESIKCSIKMIKCMSSRPSTFSLFLAEEKWRYLKKKKKSNYYFNGKQVLCINNKWHLWKERLPLKELWIMKIFTDVSIWQVWKQEMTYNAKLFETTRRIKINK